MCGKTYTKYVVNKRAWCSNNKQPKLKCKIYEHAVGYNSYKDVAVKKQSVERRVEDSGIQSTLPFVFLNCGDELWQGNNLLCHSIVTF